MIPRKHGRLYAFAFPSYPRISSDLVQVIGICLRKSFATCFLLESLGVLLRTGLYRVLLSLIEDREASESDSTGRFITKVNRMAALEKRETCTYC